MIARLIGWSIRNRFLVLLAALFWVIAGVTALRSVQLDAIPDLSDNQVIVFSDWPGRSPQVVEDQVTYPLTTNLQGLPRVKTVRGESALGYSMIQVIFNDGVDLYWARSRVLERLNSIQANLPRGVAPQLGPDGTGVGHVFWYAVQGSGQDLGTLRSIQDFYIRYALAAVPGVAEVASAGGFQREYQVEVDPERLRSYGLAVAEVARAIADSNREVGGGVVERGGSEYAIRGRGYLHDENDVRHIVVKEDGGVPVRLADVATVQMGGQPRRGVLDLNGRGEAVVGVVVMRQGENAKAVIDRIKDKIAEISPGLPPGVRIVPFYDRSELIMAAVHTLEHTLFEEGIIVSVVVLLFLRHWPSALAIILSIPMAVLGSFIVMEHLGISSNIMSLGGVAIAIGVLVDAAIVMVENAHRHLSEATHAHGEPHKRTEHVARAAKQVGKPIVFSLIIILVAFLPVFFLTGAEGKLFRPLAFTKSFAMGAGALLAVTLVPVLMTLLLRGRIERERDNPIARFFQRAYQPVLGLALRHRWTTIGVALTVTLAAIPVARSLGSEFMPPLDEGALLFMPTTLPNVSLSEAKRMLQVQDRILAKFPEVAGVLGKAGRIDSATDPAPQSMVETMILLKPQKDWPKGVKRADLVGLLDDKVQIPGVANFWTMPIINRINMLATGVRTDLGLKLYGSDLGTIQTLAERAEALLKGVPGASNVYADRFTGGRYVDVDVDRAEIARYGLRVDDVQDVIETAVGGMPLTTTVEGRQRYPVRLRVARELRDSPEAIAAIEVPTPQGPPVPLSSVARIRVTQGAPMIESENGMLDGVVYLNVSGRDMGSVVQDADARLRSGLKLPPGYYYTWTGQYQNLLHARERLRVIVPITLLLLFVLLYLTFSNAVSALLIMLAVPFALVGGVILQALMKTNYSVAVWIGYIALAGVAIETGVVMLVYLDEAVRRHHDQAGGVLTRRDLHDATVEGAVLRLRPKLMTVFAALMGLVPILWSTGTGSDVIRPIAIPMIGGLLTSSILVLIVLPVLFLSVKEWELKKKGKISWSSDSH